MFWLSQIKVKNAWQISCVRWKVSDLFFELSTHIHTHNGTYAMKNKINTKWSVAGSRFEARIVTHNTMQYFLPTLQIIKITFTKKRSGLNSRGVIPYSWDCGSRHCTELCYFIFSPRRRDLLGLPDSWRHDIFETSDTTDPKTQCYIPQILNSLGLSHYCKNPRVTWEISGLVQ
jgi:hypothetical protein